MSMSKLEIKFGDFMDSLATEEARLEFFSNPLPHLKNLGIPVPSSFDATQSKLAVDLSDPLLQNKLFARNDQGTIDSNGASLDVDVCWWGVDFILNEELTQMIIHGVDDVGSIASIIAGGVGALVSGPAALILGTAFAIAFIAKREQIKWADEGKGVHFPITWPQWAGLISQIPGGISALVVAILVLIHPFEN